MDFVELVLTKSGSSFTMVEVREDFTSHCSIPLTMCSEPIQHLIIPTMVTESEPTEILSLPRDQSQSQCPPRTLQMEMVPQELEPAAILVPGPKPVAMSDQVRNSQHPWLSNCVF